MKPELSHEEQIRVEYYARYYEETNIQSPKSNGRFPSISPLFLHLHQCVIQQVERRDPNQIEREDQYHVRQIEN